MNAARFQNLLIDPAWLLHQIDVIGHRALFYHVDPDVYRNSLFLDERIALKDPPQEIVALDELTRRLGNSEAQADLIFHIGHCGSTLLSRLLEAAAGLLALREPLPLRALAAFLRDRNHPLSLVEPETYPALEHTVMKLLARRFEPHKKTLIKATSDCGVLAERLIALEPENRAICMSLDPSEFLATMLRSELRRQETAHFAQSRLADLHKLLGSEEIRVYRLGAGELAAMSWASSMLTLAQAKERFGQRILWLDFVELLDDPRQGLTRVCEFLELPVCAVDIETAVSGGLLDAYSKDPTMRYDRAAREYELDRCRERFGGEIQAGHDWLQRLVSEHPAAQALQRLLGAR